MAASGSKFFAEYNSRKDLSMALGNVLDQSSNLKLEFTHDNFKQLFDSQLDSITIQVAKDLVNFESNYVEDTLELADALCFALLAAIPTCKNLTLEQKAKFESGLRAIISKETSEKDIKHEFVFGNIQKLSDLLDPLPKKAQEKQPSHSQ